LTFFYQPEAALVSIVSYMLRRIYKTRVPVEFTK